MNFPYLEELSFLVVLAFPKASKSGLVAKIFYSMETSSILLPPAAAPEMKDIIFLQASVFPAPDSPEIRIAEGLPYLNIFSKAFYAILNTWGASVYFLMYF